MVLKIEKPTDRKGLTIEAWAQGFMCGSLIMMAAITVANMRRRVLLHKLILIELIFGLFQSVFIFPNPPVYGWYLSTAGIFLNTSWIIHNVVAWLKSRPFLNREASMIYIGTVALSIPYWILEITANYLYFNPPYNTLFTRTRPWEALCRDPWWIFTAVLLCWNIKRRYEFTLVELIKVSPRFGILLLAMCLSICFIVVDILSVTKVIGGTSLPDGINPFWKLSFVFKCLTDTVILDDFKSALDKLKQHKMEKLGTAWSMSIGAFDQSRPSVANGSGSRMSRKTSRPQDSPMARGSTFKPTGNWEEDIERLDFCTVPDPVYLGRTKSSESKLS